MRPLRVSSHKGVMKLQWETIHLLVGFSFQVLIYGSLKVSPVYESFYNYVGMFYLDTIKQFHAS